MNQRSSATSHDLRQINRARLYHILWEKGPMTKQELTGSLGSSLPTVTQNLQELLEKGLLAESGLADSTGGRRSKKYEICREARIAIGMDIRSDSTTAVALDLSGHIIARETLEIPFSAAEPYFRALGALTDRLAGHFQPRQLLGVGIGVPALITPDHSRIFCSKVPGFEELSVEELSGFISLPVRLYHDSNAAAFAEQWTDKEKTDFFYIMLGRTVGGSFVHNGTPYLGASLRAGEIGHVTLVPAGRPCYCGKKGCADPYCSSTALSSGSLSEFFRLVALGSPEEARRYDQYLHHLSSAIHTCRTMLDCRIILGGHVGRYLTPYLPTLQSYTDELDTFGKGEPYIEICQYQDEPVAAGAALSFISQFIDTI